MKNNPARAGQEASKGEYIGEFKRYRVVPVYTPFNYLQWYVWDAEKPDDNGKPTLIKIASSREEAITGLLEEDDNWAGDR